MSAAKSDEIIELMRQANRHRFENPPEARRLYIEAIEASGKSELKRELIRALKGLGQIERDAGNSSSALSLYEEALTHCRATGDALLLAHTVRHIGDIHQDMKRDDLAEPCYREALEIYRSSEQTAPLDLANTIRPFALLKENAGEIAEAKQLWAEARDLYSASNVSQGVKECTRRLKLLEDS